MPRFHSINLTPEQQEIYDCTSMGMVITAPAGCGKTEALAYRAKGLIEHFDFNGNGRKLLVLTFTNQARDNINERIKRHLNAKAIQQRVVVRNFHGMASRIISSHGYVVGIDDAWVPASFDWIGRKLRALDVDGDTKACVSSLIRDVKQRHLSDSDVMRALNAISGKIGKISIQLENERLRERILTYDDQIRVALWILQNSKVAGLYQNHYFATIVDEFQDLTSQQMSFVAALGGKSVTYAGDLSQSIFSFAGAKPNENYQTISKNSTAEIKLTKSFRSSPAVLDAVNSLSVLTQCERLEAAFPEHWGSGGVASFVSFPSLNNESDWIVKTAEMISGRFPNHRIGIISRTAFRQSEIKRALNSRCISFVDWGDGVFKASIAKVLRAICDEITEELLERPLALLEHIKDRATTLYGSAGFPNELEDACGWLYDQLLASSPNSVKQRIVEQKANDSIATRAGIHCLTGHAGKGQQFDWVFIAGVEDDTIPFYKAKTNEEILEEARILSVMISRARIGVIMTLAERSRGHKREPSRFAKYLKNNASLLTSANQVESWFNSADNEALLNM